ncbi:MAG: IS66 family transposase [Deltaproteobacteria bacterium]|nr:IS66 family transposase [Deltaproteobacteria bacterium]
MVQALLATVAELNATLTQLRADNAELRRLLFGRKSERVEPVEREVVRHRSSPAERAARQAAGQQKRASNRTQKKALPRVEVEHALGADARCPGCAQGALRPLGADEVSEEYDFVPARLVRKVHRRRKYVCEACKTIVTAPRPARVVDGGEYGPGLYAHVVVEKCADATPIHRLSGRFRRAGVPVSRSTLTDLFHRSAELLEPLSKRLLELVAASPRVNADETTLRVQARGKTRTAWQWTFLNEQAICYVFSPSRSGDTPLSVLGDTLGTLQVDAYSGYNAVCVPDSRTRVGCWAHLRRLFFKARPTAPEAADHAITAIRELYEVEWDAAAEGLLGTDQHLAMRKTRTADLLANFHAWLTDQQPAHPPKSPIGEAIRYGLNHWRALERIKDDAKLPLDNNVSERALRIVALGRKNWLFVGHDQAGENLATLMTLTATCALHRVDPQAYLTDVLVRIADTPQSKIDELLPWNWRPPDSE